MTDETLESLIGPSAMLDFGKATEDEQRRIRAWVPMLPTLTDAAFRDLCIEVVAAGAISESQRSTEEEPYIKAAACMYEAKRRYKEAGHAQGCSGDNLYKEGFNEAGRRFGLSVSDPNPCTCGRVETP